MAAKRQPSDRRQCRQAATRSPRVYGLGHAPRGPRGACPAFGSSKLRLLPHGRRRRAPDLAWASRLDERRGSSCQVPGHRDRSTFESQGGRRQSDIRRIRCRSGACLSRPMQTVDAEGRALGHEGPPAARFRLVAAGSHYPCPCDPLVRRVQPDRVRRGQSRVGTASPDTEPRGRVRPHPDKPDTGCEAEPPSEAHSLPVARRSPAPSPCAGPLRRHAAVASNAG